MAFPEGWSGYYEIVSDYTKIPEVPGVVWIPLSTAPSAFWDALDASGDTTGRTIRVSNTSNVLKPCFVDGLINTSLRTGGLFFRDTSLSTSVNTTLRVWSGGAASMPAVTDSEGRNACFASYAGFYLPGVTLTDLTGGGRDLTAVNSPGTTAAYEGIDAATYNGSTQYHKYEGTQAVTGWPLTLEVTAYTSQTTANQSPFALANNSTSLFNYAQISFRGELAGPPADPIHGYFQGASGSSSQARSSTGYTGSTTHYIAITRDANSGTSRAYLSGGSLGTDTTTITTPTFDRLGIGATVRNGSAGNLLNGRVAAAYLSSSVRSADYVATMHDVWDNAIFTPGGWTAMGTDTGWVLFQAAANVSGGDTAWTDVANALDDDADYANVSLSLEDTSDFLTLTNPAGVSIPSGATITGVWFRIKRNAPGGDIQDYEIFAVKGGTRVGNNLADLVTEWTASDVTVDYGGTLLGTTWTDGDFGTNYGVAIRVLDKDAGADTARVITVWTKIAWSVDPAANTTNFFLTAA